MRAREFLQMLRDAAVRWWDDNPFRLGAALAFYTVFSIAPIVLIAIAIASLVFGREAAQGHILDEISLTVGPQVGQAIADVLHYTSTSGSTTLATVISVIVLLVGATSVFVELQDALDTIWRVAPKPGRPWLVALKERFWSF